VVQKQYRAIFQAPSIFWNTNSSYERVFTTGINAVLPELRFRELWGETHARMHACNAHNSRFSSMLVCRRVARRLATFAA